MPATTHPWTPAAVAGEEFVPQPRLWGYAALLLVARILTTLGLLILFSAELWAAQWQKPVIGYYVLGAGLVILFGGIWFLLIWNKPQPIRLVLGPDRLQLQQDLAEVIDDVPYRLIREVTVIYFPKLSGGGERGLALRITNLDEYLAVWPQYRARRQRDQSETSYDWFLTNLNLPWRRIAEELRKKLIVGSR